MIEKLRTMVDKERFEHSLGVEQTAVELAKIHGADVEKARLAGLLHDCAKFSVAQTKEFCETYGVDAKSCEFEDMPLPLIHAPIGAMIIKQAFGVDDPEISSAIAAHTTGKTDMSQLDKIIFLADYAEPGRGDDPEIEEIRRLAKVDLDEALLKSMEFSIHRIENRGREVYHTTLEAYNDLAQKMGRNKWTQK